MSEANLPSDRANGWWALMWNALAALLVCSIWFEGPRGLAAAATLLWFVSGMAGAATVAWSDDNAR